MPGPDRLFSIVNLLASLCWVALTLLPGERWVGRWLAGVAVPALLAFIYTALILSNWGGPGSFAFGPAGWLAYQGVRSFAARVSS